MQKSFFLFLPYIFSIFVDAKKAFPKLYKFNFVSMALKGHPINISALG